MRCQKDPDEKLSEVANVFVKNLERSIDNKALYDIFVTFGNIVSCKVEVDGNGNSKGYGFIQFESPEVAEKCIDSLNDSILNAQKLHVTRFIPREEREKETMKSLKNVYVSNFGDNFKEETMRSLFSNYGPITSLKLFTNEAGKSLGYGFVGFESADCAKRAIDELNEKVIGSKPLFVGHAQKNLYVKNLDDAVDDEMLSKEFGPFGTITSAKVMKDNGRSKGFGFVCYSTTEEATRALAEMNRRLLINKPLYVAMAQRKEERQAFLIAKHKRRMANTQFKTNYNFIIN
ncbi:polyadenylate-binding protein 1-A [Aethina tumida]|uniref:polyadenylate-binding protein 1-A n=1 Tax=Aethina tumida TaxID=116153 RepID=UPI00096B15C1|nr:polyadenylate-binding protein 1-A [Aethina tumida]